MPSANTRVNARVTGTAHDAAPAPARRSSYHHGDLRAAMLEAAEQVIVDCGVDGFSVREATRRAGVSPAAPRHHFPDSRSLLTAVAAAGFTELGAALAAADRAAARTLGSTAGADVRAARLHAQSLAYVHFALAHPGRFDVMWRRACIDPADPAYAVASQRALDVLLAAVAGADPDRPSDAPGAEIRPADADPRALATWALVHGFARLALDGAFGIGPEAARAAADRLLPAVLAAAGPVRRDA